MNIKDGGYYAIKGFEFQIDKAILEILNASDEDELISIEKIQDINSANFVIQVKYKETQKFIPSKIKEPIIQLLKEFEINRDVSYYLYSFFGDLNGYQKFADENNRITSNNLDIILGNKKDYFTSELKNSFINCFYLDFAPTFQKQFDSIIKKLRGLDFIGNSFDEAVFYYANITDYLRKLVVNNTDVSKRNCSQKQVFDYVKGGTQLVFNSAYKEYKGSNAYFKFVKSKFIKAKKNQENFIFIGNVEVDNSVTSEKLILDILDRYYKRAQHDIFPLSFIIFDDNIMQIKKNLIFNNIFFNDGKEAIQFNSKMFFTPPVSNKKISRNKRATESLGNISFKLRVLSYSNFRKIKDHNITPHMIYYFDSDVLENFNSVSYMKIDKFNTKQILDIFTF